MFGFAFGMYWSSVYEHIAWRKNETPQLKNERATLTKTSNKLRLLCESGCGLCQDLRSRLS